jgi:hypothetical protein
LPLLFFQKVAEALGINWLALIPVNIQTSTP